MDDEDAKAIAKGLRIKTTDFEQKALGRIPSRMNARKTTSPLLEKRPICSLFLDESGTSASSGSDGTFAIGAVAMCEPDILDYVSTANEIKTRYFGTLDHTFHEPMMRKRSGMYRFQGDLELQRAFAGEFAALVNATPFVAFGVGIRKQAFAQDFASTGLDPYLPTKLYDLALMLLLERFVDYMAYKEPRHIGRVHLESIGSLEDAEHQAAYADLLLHGTQWVSDSVFRSWLETGCRFSPKTGSNPAELADLVAREVFEYTRSDGQESPCQWSVIGPKFYLREDGLAGKFGLKIFPDSDIRAKTLEFRNACGGAC